MKLTFNLVILAFTLLSTLIRAEETAAPPTVAAEDAVTDDAPQLVLKAMAATNVPVDPAGDVVMVQARTNKPSWVIYQDRAQGDIVAMRVSGPFSHGHLTKTVTVVPANRVLPGTPLAVAHQHQDANDPGTVQLFFFDGANVLSEARWTKERGWFHGTDCSVCVDQKKRYQAISQNKILYARASLNEHRKAGMRVGFQSVDYSGTIAEADRQGGNWVLAPLTQA
ncbi:hypothetical protein V5O48_014803 [Marasmius crinis-equi]|uniref:Uncharacterized protein n=1 Tax=Marasmius crinis-equi TaxID=585013 RepID=A0ABR3EW89_9AGAR